MPLLRLPKPVLWRSFRPFDELIEDARVSILSEKVNVFDLYRVISFIHGRHFRRPPHTKLLNRIYQRYRAVWRKLLCYVYRLTIAHQGPDLHYILTPDQLEAISQIPASTLPTRSESVVGQPTRSSPSSSSAPILPPRLNHFVLLEAGFSQKAPTTARFSPPYCFPKRAVVTAPADHSSSEEESTVSDTSRAPQRRTLQAAICRMLTLGFISRYSIISWRED